MIKKILFFAVLLVSIISANSADAGFLKAQRLPGWGATSGTDDYMSCFYDDSDGSTTLSVANDSTTITVVDDETGKVIVSGKKRVVIPGDATGYLVNLANGSKATTFSSSTINPTSSSPSDNTSGSAGGSGGSSSSSSGGSSGTSGSGSGGGTQLVPCDGVDCTLEQLKTVGTNIFNYLAGFGALLAIGAIIISGFSYITSQGDSGKMAEAKKKIVLAIIGLVVLAISVLLVNTILKVFGVQSGVTGFSDVEGVQ